MNLPSVDAVIVSYNSATDLAELGRQREMLLDSFENVVVVDNASTDDSVLVARRAGFEVLAQAANHGFAAAVNVGWRQSSADVIAIVNPDIRLSGGDDVTGMARAFDDPSVGLVAPALRLLDGSIQDSARKVPTPVELVIRRRWSPRHGEIEASSAVEVPWVVGAFAMARRSALEAVGGLDEEYFLYFEDVDLCVRLRRNGWRIVYDPTIVLQHEHRAESRTSLSGWATRRHARSALRFYRRNPRLLVRSEPGLVYGSAGVPTLRRP